MGGRCVIQSDGRGFEEEAKREMRARRPDPNPSRQDSCLSYGVEEWKTDAHT